MQPTFQWLELKKQNRTFTRFFSSLSVKMVWERDYYYFPLDGSFSEAGNLGPFFLLSY